MKEIKGFRNSWILTEAGLLKTNLLIENEKISKLGNFECEGLIELEENKIVVPGFIDQHTHGAFGFDIIDGTQEALKEIAICLAQEGVTNFLATTTTESIMTIEKALNAISIYIDSHHSFGSEIIGIHLEGPFISEQYSGAQFSNAIIEPNIEIFKELEEISNSNIKQVTLAIEENGSKELISYLISRGINVSIGHSNASYLDVEKAIKQGVSCVTHTYNAQKPIHHREIGVVGASMLFDELYCEIICDGVHLSYPAIQILWKNKPADKIILITDSLRVKNMSNGRYSEPSGQTIILDGKIAKLENQVLAGSVLKMNEAIENIITNLEINLTDAIRCATENPAKNLGIFDKVGSIKEGKLANFVVIDKNINVYQTIRRGKVIYKKNF